MKHVRWAWLPILLVLLGACTTSNPPVEAEPEFMLSTDVTPLREGPRLDFLPPLGSSEATGVFDADVPLEIKIFATTADGVVTGDPIKPIEPTFSTSDGSIYIKNGYFRADWVVPTTMIVPDEYVRVEVRYAVGPSPDVPVCDPVPVPKTNPDPNSAPEFDSRAVGSCFGYFRARLVPNSGTDTSDTPGDVLVVVRERTVPITFFVRESTGEVEELGSLKSLRKVNNNKPFTDATTDNCTEFDTPGQGLQAVGAGFQAVGAGFQAVGAGFQAVGAVGGLFRGEFDSDSPATHSLATTDVVASQIRSILGAASANDLVADMVADPDGPVAILVVDDFGSGASTAYELPEDLFAADLVVTHGALVFEHILALLDTALGYVPPELAGTGKDKPKGWVVSKEGEGGPTIAYSATYVPGKPSDSVPLVVVKALNTEGGDTDAILEVITDSIPVVVDTVSYPNVVVNMSFAIVPCATSTDVDGSAQYVVDLSGDGELSLEDYILALAEINDVKLSERDELTSLTSFVTTPLGVTTPGLPEDALLAYLSPCPSPSTVSTQLCASEITPEFQSIVHVASSGNFGYSFPFFPAALGSVVSVGSQDVVGGKYTQEAASFSNGSEILTPGVFVADRREKSRDGTAFTEVVAYAGTSFSAPNVSVFTALDVSLQDLSDEGGVSDEVDARLCDPGTATALADLAFADGDVSDSENLPLGGAFASSAPTAIAYCNK